VEHPVCCGIDVHKDTRTACLRRVDANGQVRKEGREFATTSPSLLAVSDGLVEQPCPVVALESTGVDWKPGYHVLAGAVEVCIGNAHAMRSRPGKKTDKRDAAWIAARLAHGLIRPSFVPPPAMCAWRDVTRTRVALVQTRSQSKNRVHKLLEETNLKLGRVVSALFGVTGRRRLAALVAGERDPQGCASLALGAFKHKRPQLARALTGQCTAPHGTWLGLLVERIERLDRQMATLAQQLGELVAPMQAQLAQLDSMPGVDSLAARDILAEIGTAMRRFGDAARLASWAGVCPGNHESAGTRDRGKTCQGNRSLRRVLVPCAWGARKTPTCLGRTFRRLEVRIGKKKATRAIAHNILVIVSHLLALGTCDEEARDDQWNPRQEARERKRAIKALERLG
jgi:transposase